MYVTSLSSMAIRARWPMTCGCIVRMNNPRSSYAPSNSAFQIENTSSGVMVGRTVDARSIQSDFVMARLHNGLHRGLVEHRTDGRHEERGRNPVRPEQREHTRQARARSVLSLRQERGTCAAITERAGLVVDVERESNRDPCPVGPGPRREIAASPDPAHDLADLRVGQGPGARRCRCLLAERRRCSYETEDRDGEHDGAFHGSLLSGSLQQLTRRTCALVTAARVLRT